LDRRLDGPQAGLEAVLKRKIPNPYWDSNPGSSSPYPSAMKQTKVYYIDKMDVSHNIVT
jgi:hypothetical protein